MNDTATINTAPIMAILMTVFFPSSTDFNGYFLSSFVRFHHPFDKVNVGIGRVCETADNRIATYKDAAFCVICCVARMNFYTIVCFYILYPWKNPTKHLCPPVGFEFW